MRQHPSLNICCVSRYNFWRPDFSWAEKRKKRTTKRPFPLKALVRVPARFIQCDKSSAASPTGGGCVGRDGQRGSRGLHVHEPGRHRADDVRVRGPGDDSEPHGADRAPPAVRRRHLRAVGRERGQKDRLLSLHHVAERRYVQPEVRF